MSGLSLAIPSPDVRPGEQLTAKLTVSGPVDDSIQEARVELVSRLTYSANVRVMSKDEAHRRRQNGETPTEHRIERQISESTVGDVLHFFPDDLAGEHEATLPIPADAAPSASPAVVWLVRATLARKHAGDTTTDTAISVLCRRDTPPPWPRRRG